MKRFATHVGTLILMLFLLPYSSLANNYYISVTNGDDARTPAQAQNPATPWKTVTPAKLIFGTLVPGDSILFMRGEKHIASDIRPTVSGTAAAPIAFGAYGTGANPVLSGATTITGFTATATPGLFSKILSSGSAIRFVFNNGERQPIARHPNAGFFYTTSIPAAAPRQSFIDVNLPQTTTDYWKGANVGIRFEDWEWFNDSVTAYNAITKQITLKSTAYGNLRSGWGYFFTNKLEIVDSVGEWYQNGNTLYYYQPPGTDPATISLDIVSTRNAFVLRNLNYVTIANLSIEKYASDAVYADITGSPLPPYNQGLSFLNLDISFPYTRGIELRNSTNTVIENCKIRDAQYEGVGIEACIGTNMKNTEVVRTGLVPGLQYRGGTGIAVRPIGTVTGSKNYITECLIDSTGKYGIRLEDSLTVVERTVIKRSSMTITDVGAIYLITPTCGKDTIRNCFTSETGAYFGGYPLSSITAATGKGMGLYVDDFAHDAWLENNTSYGNSRYGIHLINGRNCTVKGNTTYGNGLAELSYQEANSRTPRIPAGWCKYDVQNNVFFATTPQEFVVRQETQDYNGADFGVLNNNVYHHPTDNEVFYIFRPMHLNEPLTSPPTGPTFKTLALATLPEFRAFSNGQDLNSKRTKFKFNQYTVSNTLSPNLIDNSTFESGITGWTNESSSDFDLTQVTALNGQALSYKAKASIVNRKSFTYGEVMNNDLAVTDYCQLKFTVKAMNPYTTLRPYFAQNISPYGQSGFGKDVNATTAAQNYDLIFPVGNILTSSVLKFNATIDAGEYLVDDVSLQKVSVTTNDLVKQRFFPNPSSSPLTIQLNESGISYFDLDSIPLGPSVTVPAWSSMIVFAIPVQILPVTLVEYEVITTRNTAIVKWATTAEQNNDYFEVEHSTDGQKFYKLGLVKGIGNSSSKQSYNYQHSGPATGINYYRLIQVDRDGKRKQFEIKAIIFKLGKEPSVRLYLNPSGKQLKALYDPGSFTQAHLIDINGRLLQQKKVLTTDVASTFDLNGTAPGVYVIRFSGLGTTVSKQFIKPGL